MLPLWMYGFGCTKLDYAQQLEMQAVPIEMDFTSELTKTILLERIDVLTHVLEMGGEIPIGDEKVQNDILGHLILRVVCSQNEFEMDWFVRREGYLFSSRFKELRTFAEKYEVLKQFFKDSVLTIDEFLAKYPNIDSGIRSELELKQRAPTKLIAIRWFYVSRLIAKRECLLNDGWAIVDADSPRIFLRDWFEEDLRQKMTALQTEYEKIDTVLELSSELEGVVREKSGVILGIEDIDDILAKSPMCIVELDQFLSEGKELGYTESLQLSLYMKSTLTHEDWKRYFYLKHPANKNRSWEEWDKEWGYHFQHQAGLVGSRTDYNPYGCAKARDEGHCPFKGVNDQAFIKHLRERHTDNIDQERVERLLKIIHTNAGKNPNQSCTAEFSLRFGVDPVGILTHPVKGYYRMARQTAESGK